MADVDDFVREKGLQEHVLLFRKGAIVAQDPENFENITGPDALTEAETLTIRNEIDHKWRMPWRLFLTIFTCSIGAAVQGWDQTGSNGANIFFPAEYGIDGPTVGDKIIVGLVNAGPYIGSA